MLLILIFFQTEKDILSERLDDANKKIKELTERLEASEKANKAAPAAPAPAPAKAEPKAGLSINIIVQSFIVLLVFIIGFFIAKLDIVKKMM